MSELVFRALTPADLEVVADLTHRADPFGWTLRNFSDAHASGNTLTVLSVDGRTAGIAAVMHVIDESELLEIAVEPAMQGRGYGKALLKEVMSLARRNGAARMFWKFGRATPVRVKCTLRSDLKKPGVVRITTRREMVGKMRF